MSTIQPQMNTASFASLAGSPKASAGDAPQGLDFLTILAGSQLPRGAADAADPAPQAALAQALPIAGGNAGGTAGGKILPGPAKGFAASHAHPAFTGLQRSAGEAAPAVETADAMLAQAGNGAAKQSDGPELAEGALDAGAELSIEPAPHAMIATEANALPIQIPAFVNQNTQAAKAPQADTSGGAADHKPARLAPELFAMRTTTPVPAALAPLAAEAMQAIEAKSLTDTQSRARMATATSGNATSASATGDAGSDGAAVPANGETLRAPELAPVTLNRTMSAAAAVPASTLIAARAGEPAKSAAAADAATPVPSPVDAASDTPDVEAESDPLARPNFAAQATTIDTPASGVVPNAASMVQDAGAPRPLSGVVAAQPDTVQPQDFETLVGRLTEAREAANPNLVRAAINHAEFGQISLAFRADDSRMAVTMSSSDPALAPAVLAAAASAAQAAGNESGTRDQNAQNQQQAQQNGQQQAQQQQSSGHAAQSGLGNAAQGQADRQSPNGRTASAEGRNPASSSSGDTTSEAPAAPRSNPPGIYA
jgi:hypothetical protein